MNSLWSDLFISYSLFLLNQTILSTLLEIVIESCHSSSIRNIPKLLKTYLIQLARYLDSTSKLLGNFLFVTKGPREQWHASSCIPNVDPRGRTPQEYGTIEMDKWIMWKDVKRCEKHVKEYQRSNWQILCYGGNVRTSSTNACQASSNLNILCWVWNLPSGTTWRVTKHGFKVVPVGKFEGFDCRALGPLGRWAVRFWLCNSVDVEIWIASASGQQTK